MSSWEKYPFSLFTIWITPIFLPFPIFHWSTKHSFGVISGFLINFAIKSSIFISVFENDFLACFCNMTSNSFSDR